MAEALRLLDTFGRSHNDLRVSVTDRCNIRCFHCMPERDVEFVPRAEILSFEEIERFVKIAAGLGVAKVRVTGGEPLLRHDLPALIRKLASISGIRDLALTTNGILLAGAAEALHEAGLRRVNIHLDTVDRDRFLHISRRDELARVFEGIAACRRAGYHPIKLNAVVLKGLSEPDIVPLARFARDTSVELRFIEFMPLDAQGAWLPDRVLPTGDIIDLLSREIAPLSEVPDPDPRATALEYRYADGGGTVGFIASVSRPFCSNCSRLRLTADGKLRYCLFALEETDVRSLLRNGAADAEIAGLVRSTVRAKWAGHQINTARFVAPPRPMYAIGG